MEAFPHVSLRWFPNSFLRSSSEEGDSADQMVMEAIPRISFIWPPNSFIRSSMILSLSPLLRYARSRSDRASHKLQMACRKGKKVVIFGLPAIDRKYYWKENGENVMEISACSMVAGFNDSIFYTLCASYALVSSVALFALLQWTLHPFIVKSKKIYTVLISCKFCGARIGRNSGGHFSVTIPGMLSCLRTAYLWLPLKFG
ncbi:hypothetical protein RJ641_007564 [Dillenia turbinata]|uniref:Uncharacterized protein n=1 Tax=Dillenia turbinata TaxID=194707 RepID=A0AAN8Z822_9MAGN